MPVSSPSASNLKGVTWDISKTGDQRRSDSISMGGNEAYHAVDIGDDDFFRYLNSTVNKLQIVVPQREEAESGLIFRAPDGISASHSRSFVPQVVSIGPYHFGERELQKTESLKQQFVRYFLLRTSVTLGHYLRLAMDLEERVRACYLDIKKMGQEDFIQMLVIDGCFVIELMCEVVGTKMGLEKDADPILRKPSSVSPLISDLLKLENQLPFFFLNELFNLHGVGCYSELSFQELVCRFFNVATMRPRPLLSSFPEVNSEVKHLLHFVHCCFLELGTNAMSFPRAGTTPSQRAPGHKKPEFFGASIPCAKRLKEARIKLKKDTRENNMWGVNFRNGLLEISPLILDDYFTSLLLNCVAFEQVYRVDHHYFSSYAMFMVMLINTERDVSILCDKQIIDNGHGRELLVLQLFNRLREAIDVASSDFMLSNQVADINDYYLKNYYNLDEFRMGFIDYYLSSIWVFLSTLGVVFLLLLAIVQTTFSVLGYFKSQG